MTECEKVICKMYLEDMHDNCNENRLLLQMLEAEPCEDAISRRAVNTLIDELARAISDERCCISRGRSTATIMRDIYHLPPVTPQPKTGHWIKYGTPRCGEQHYQCTLCGYYINFGQWGKLYSKEFKFCPNCGGKMENEEQT